MRFTAWQKKLFQSKYPTKVLQFNMIWIYFGFKTIFIQRMSRFKSTYNQYLIFIAILLNQILIYSYHIHKNLKPGTKHI